MDALISLAIAAKYNNYSRPSLNISKGIKIVAGRHPILESKMGNGFVPNDLEIGIDHTLFIITGPNMSGKSTFMRQVALITLMSQVGSFVPCKSATIGIVDKIFARIGSRDNIDDNQSTFMVEMSEMANIIHNSSKHSLVIVDEVGRGTGTYDGISIAWAISEHLIKSGIKTLFATHLHELTQLSDLHKGICNLSTRVEEKHGSIVFLKEMQRCRSAKSYGIEIARMAGIPHGIIKRASELIKKFEKETTLRGG